MTGSLGFRVGAAGKNAEIAPLPLGFSCHEGWGACVVALMALVAREGRG